MKYLKTFETYSVEELEGGKVYSEKCPDCNCDCDDCECDDCECEDCKGHKKFSESAEFKCQECDCECQECECQECDCDGCKSYGDWKSNSVTEKKKAKPDFLDLDKDGDKKESMKKAAKDAKSDKKEEKGGKGLTAAQKKLPEGLRKAILARKKK